MSQDRIRQLVVTVSGVVCVFGTLLGTGVIGTRVAESSGGTLAADATLIAPASTAFSIWSVIYLGLLAYVIWQWLPAHRRDDRLRATGYLGAASMVLNAAWLMVTQVGWLWVSVAVMIALLVTLGRLVDHLARRPATSTVERVAVDGTFGLYLGWVCVATCANIAATLVASGVPATGGPSEVATVVVIAVVVGLAAFLARRLPAQYAVGVGITWGLVWVAVARFTDQPQSTAVGVVAAAAALATVALYLRSRAATTATSATARELPAR